VLRKEKRLLTTGQITRYIIKSEKEEREQKLFSFFFFSFSSNGPSFFLLGGACDFFLDFDLLFAFLLLFHTFVLLFSFSHSRCRIQRERRRARARERECQLSGGKETPHARTRDAFGLFTSCEQRGFNIRFSCPLERLFFFTFRGRESADLFLSNVFRTGKKTNSQVRARERPSREPSGENAGSDDGVGVLHGFEEEGCE